MFLFCSSPLLILDLLTCPLIYLALFQPRSTSKDYDAVASQEDFVGAELRLPAYANL